MGTQASQLQNFGRAWNISIAVPGANGSSTTYTLASGTQETLRVQFEIETRLLVVYWTCKITIFNMSNQTASAITQNTPTAQALWNLQQPISAGNTVTVSAGYQYGPSGAFQPQSSIVYQGQVLQAYWLREDIVNTKLVLRCITGFAQLNFVALSLSSGKRDLDTVNAVASAANLKTNIDSGSMQALQQSQYSRGQTFHDRPYNILRPILKQNGLNGWIDNTGLNIKKYSASDTPPTPPFSYCPVPQPGGVTSNGTFSNVIQPNAQSSNPLMPTLLGTPEQTQYGVVFRVLMDSTPKIGGTVQLAPGTIINPVELQVGALPPVASLNGLYYVAGLRYVGDSRGHGEDWYTEVTGVVPNFFQLLQQASANNGN